MGFTALTHASRSIARVAAGMSGQSLKKAVDERRGWVTPPRSKNKSAPRSSWPSAELTPPCAAVKISGGCTVCTVIVWHAACRKSLFQVDCNRPFVRTHHQAQHHRAARQHLSAGQLRPARSHMKRELGFERGAQVTMWQPRCS